MVKIPKPTQKTLRDMGSIPVSRRSLGEESEDPLQYSCLVIPWIEETNGYSPGGCIESDMTEVT